MSKINLFDMNFKNSKFFNKLKSKSESKSESESNQNPNKFTQINFQSDISNTAEFTNSNVVNSWGIVAKSDCNSETVVSVINNGSGTFIQLNGQTGETIGNPINIPGAQPETGGNPTGLVAVKKSTTGYFGGATYLTATEDGTIQYYNPSINSTNFIIAVNNSNIDPSLNAVYKGLALYGNILYVANFRSGLVEKYAPDFSLLGTFTDTSLTDIGYAPFNMVVIKKLLYVIFAKQDTLKHDDVSGQGNGFINIYDLSGTFINRFLSRGALNSPWGISAYGDYIIIGNFGDGRINLYSTDSTLIGPLVDKYKNIIAIDKLWGIATIKNDGNIYFSAGINDEQNGLIGKLDI